MTHAGLPWRADVHERLLTELLGPRPVSGQRPAVLERLLAEIRAAFGRPDLNPDSPGELLRALQAAGLPVSDTRSWTLEQLDHPGIPALLEYKKLSRLLQANGWNWLDTWVARRPVPLVLPARRRGHRAVGLQRRRSAVRARRRCAPRRSPTTAGGSSSRTSPSWSRGCSPA